MYKPKNILVIGGNAAGPAAAAKAKRICPEADVILFEEGDYISTGTCEIPFVFSGEISCHKDIIFYTAESFFKEKAVEVYINHRVEEIDRRKKTISVRNLKTKKQSWFSYDSLILATGSKSRKVTLLPDGLENVFYLKSVKDLILLNEYCRQNNVKSAAIIGAGYIGLEIAEAFRTRKIETTIIEQANLPFPQSDPEIQYLIKELLYENSVSFYGGIPDIKPVINHNKVKALNIDGRRLEFDILLAATGIQPNNSLAIQSRLEVGKYGGLKVDKKLKTNDSSIFAAGDNIEVINAITGKSDYLPFATLAHLNGHIAGENAAGGNILAEPALRNSAMRFFNNSLTAVGLTAAEAKSHGFIFESVNAVVPNIIKVMPGSKNVFGKIIYEKNTSRILGASFLGGREVTGYGDLISSLILTKANVNTLRRITFNYTPPLSPFVNLLSVLGRKVK